MFISVASRDSTRGENGNYDMVIGSKYVPYLYGALLVFLISKSNVNFLKKKVVNLGLN